MAESGIFLPSRTTLASQLLSLNSDFRWKSVKPGPTADDRFPLENDRFEIERLSARRTRAIGRNARRFTEYLVRWRGFSEAHDEWIRRENLSGAQDLVDEFDAREDEQST